MIPSMYSCSTSLDDFACGVLLAAGLSGCMHACYFSPLIAPCLTACVVQGRVYVDKAEQELLGTLEGLLKDESWAPMEDAGDTHVLHSASALFAALKHTLAQCSKNISKGGAMLELMRAFQVV